jgi:hypothetical protein
VLAPCPTVSLDGVTAHELATQLGTVADVEANGGRSCSPGRCRRPRPRRRARARVSERAPVAPRAGQALRRDRRGRPRRPDGRAGRRLRLPRPERRGQDDLAAHAARPDPADRGRRRCSAATRSSTGRRRSTASPASSRGRASTRT